MNQINWQTRDQMPEPTNPLQELREVLTRTSRDISEDKLLSWIYGIIVGWDDEAYQELKELLNWTDSHIERLKILHSNYEKAWSLFMEDLRKTPAPNYTAVPDWATAPSWANWCAHDSNGAWYYYEVKPVRINGHWGSTLGQFEFICYRSNWETSLQERPQKQDQ